MRIESLSFENNNFLPSNHTCDGENVSPELHWQDVPSGTKSFVLIMDDPDAPNGFPWTHWVIYNLPANINSLEENVEQLPSDAQFGANSWGKQTYRGPCLPEGLYRYCFKLYALDTILVTSSAPTSEELMFIIHDHILDKAELMGRYKRQTRC